MNRKKIYLSFVFSLLLSLNYVYSQDLTWYSFGVNDLDATNPNVEIMVNIENQGTIASTSCRVGVYLVTGSTVNTSDEETTSKRTSFRSEC
jgi:hypothetical protein